MRPSFHTTSKGYQRYHTGEHRDEYVHRVVIADLLGYPIPDNFHVHHIDFVRDHNCTQNLMLIQAAIHDLCNPAPRCPYTGRYMNRKEAIDLGYIRLSSEEVPDWVETTDPDYSDSECNSYT